MDLEAALPDLYVGKKTVITRLPENTDESVRLVEQAWQLCGAIIHHLSAEEHDSSFRFGESFATSFGVHLGGRYRCQTAC